MATASSTLAFSKDVGMLLSAGLSVREALQAMSQDIHSPTSQIAISLFERLQSGQSLSRALAEATSSPPVLVAMVAAGESTGSVPTTIDRYVAYAETLQVAQRRLASALIYPAIVSFVGTGVCAFILLYLVPRLADVYTTLNRQLPPFSRELFAFGSWISAHPMLTTLAIGAILLLAFWLLFASGGRRIAWRIVVSIDWVGRRWRSVALSRFYRTAAMLTQSGIPLRKAIAVASPASGAFLQPAVDSAEQDLLKGCGIVRALNANGLTTPATEPILLVGERSGEMSTAFDRVADYLDRRMEQDLDLTLRFAEPVIGLLMSIAVGALLLLMYMPIIEIAGGIL